jgi:predicted MPP superfamily phosphohydrolase
LEVSHLKQAIYYGSYLVFPFVAYVGYRLKGDSRRRWIGVLLLCSALVFIWGRFIEPQIITVEEHRASPGFPARIALISDVHAGLYKGERFLRRLVEKLNALNVDVVLIAGDLIYEPDRPLVELFAPFRGLRHKAYAIRGNHDSEMPGPPVERELRQALAAAGVRLVENEAVRIGGYTLVGLGDLWAGNDKVEMLKAFSASDNVVVLVHNPDAVARFPPGIVDITLAGHTHGGQVRIPRLYRAVIPTRMPFDRGWHDLPGTRVFVTSGVGEIGLPLRFLVPPVIDVIVLN